MLLKKFLGAIIGIVTGIYIAMLCNDLIVFIPNIQQHELLITIGAGVSLYICLNKYPLWHGILLGVMGVLIVDLLGGLTFRAVSCGIVVTVILYACMGILKKILAFYPQHKLD